MAASINIGKPVHASISYMANMFARNISITSFHSSNVIDAVHSGKRLSLLLVLAHIFLLLGSIRPRACVIKDFVMEFVVEVGEHGMSSEIKDEHL